MQHRTKRNETALPEAWEQTRVVKKFSARQTGALKLAQQFGNALVCVRHRHDASGEVRYTTVELLVEQRPITKSRTPRNEIVRLRIAVHEFELLRLIKSQGAEWDRQSYAWRLPRKTVEALGLMDRAIPL